MVLICIYLMIRGVVHLSHACWPSGSLWRKVCSAPFNFFYMCSFINLFTSLWLRWVLAAARAFLWLWRAEATPWLWCVGFSLLWLLLLQNVGLERHHVVVTQGFGCPEACGICTEQGSPVSPALAGGFFTTESPEKPLLSPFLNLVLWVFVFEL